MKKLVLAMFVFVFCFASKAYSDGHGIKMGIILGFTGPIESLTPAMAASAALKGVNIICHLRCSCNEGDTLSDCSNSRSGAAGVAIAVGV